MTWAMMKIPCSLKRIFFVFTNNLLPLLNMILTVDEDDDDSGSDCNDSNGENDGGESKVIC